MKPDSNNPSRVTSTRLNLIACALLAVVCLSTAASAVEATYKHFRFYIDSSRNPNDSLTQLSEFRLINNGTPIAMSGATLTSSGPTGNYDPLSLLIDGSTAVGWSSYAPDRSVLFEFPAPITIDAYNFATGTNANRSYDPISWKLEGGSNGITWTIIDLRTDYSTTYERSTYQSVFSLDSLKINQFSVFHNIVLNGTPVDLTWATTDATTVTIDNGVGAVNPTGTISLIPPNSADTTYTLTASNLDANAQANLIVRSVDGGSVNCRYVRFTPTKARGADFYIEISELYMKDGATTLTAVSATTPNSALPVANLIDNNSSTKWESYAPGPVILDYGVPVNITNYGFVTAYNGGGSYDPVRWTLDGSNDNTTWTPIDNVTAFDYTMPVARAIATELPIPAGTVVALPALQIVASSFNFVTDELSLTWTSSDTKTYRVTSSTNLLEWNNVLAGGLTGLATQTSTTVSFTQDVKAFFRVEEE